ncbi:hypothetical protein O3M35_009825 [Rhynocoris fuscipes]|uniref:Uncharacterized protein n=1 Tax=Rhynocoris fuscipes TaxID=488301 RepID=A0AAW1D715_9HEMI
MILYLYTVLLFITVSQCRVIVFDNDCIKRCVEELQMSNRKAKIICIVDCNQLEGSPQIAEDTDIESKIKSTARIPSFLRDVLNSLITLSKGFDDNFDENILTFSESDKINLHDIIRRKFIKKRDAEFRAKFCGKSRSESVSGFLLDRSGLKGNLNSRIGYEGMGSGNANFSGGPVKLQGGFNGNIGGASKLGLSGNLGGPKIVDVKGNWAHVGQTNVSGKGTAKVYDISVGGAGGKLSSNYSNEGIMAGGLLKGGLVGVEYNAKNVASLYGIGGAGAGHPIIGTAAGIVGEGAGNSVELVQGGLGLVYGNNGLGISSKSNTQSHLSGILDMKGGVGSYDKYGRGNQYFWGKILGDI